MAFFKPSYGRVKKAKANYPLIPSCIISFFRSFAAAAVTAMMCYFIYYLNKDTHNYKIPFTFIMLLIAGLVTFIFSIIKFFASCCFGMNPLFSLCLNSALLAVWTAGGGSLGYFAGHTLINACDDDNWGIEGRGGHYVCRMYKWLFTCVAIAWFFTLCAVILDIHVRRKQNRLGKYQRMGDGDHKPLVAGHHDDDPWSMEMGPQPHSSGKGKYEPLKKPAHGRHYRQSSAQPLNTQPPSYDTSYHGPGGHPQGEAASYYHDHGAGPTTTTTAAAAANPSQAI